CGVLEVGRGGVRVLRSFGAAFGSPAAAGGVGVGDGSGKFCTSVPCFCLCRGMGLRCGWLKTCFKVRKRGSNGLFDFVRTLPGVGFARFLSSVDFARML